MSFDKGYTRRKQRVRAQIACCNKSKRVRLSVSRANKNIYAQIIDLAGKILVSASSLEKEVVQTIIGSDKKRTKSGLEIASQVGALIAERAKKAGINTVVFDTSGYLYSGRVKSLAEAAREAGLEF